MVRAARMACRRFTARLTRRSANGQEETFPDLQNHVSGLLTGYRPGTSAPSQQETFPGRGNQPSRFVTGHRTGTGASTQKAPFTQRDKWRRFIKKKHGGSVRCRRRTSLDLPPSPDEISRYRQGGSGAFSTRISYCRLPVLCRLSCLLSSTCPRIGFSSASSLCRRQSVLFRTD